MRTSSPQRNATTTTPAAAATISIPEAKRPAAAVTCSAVGLVLEAPPAPVLLTGNVPLPAADVKVVAGAAGGLGTMTVLVEIARTVEARFPTVQLSLGAEQDEMVYEVVL